jgi:hypothetical protein
MTYANWVPVELENIHEASGMLNGFDSQVLQKLKSRFDSLLSSSLSEGPWRKFREMCAPTATRHRDISLALNDPTSPCGILAFIKDLERSEKAFQILNLQVSGPSDAQILIFEHSLVYDFLANSFYLAETSEPMKRWTLTTVNRNELVEEIRKHLVQLERKLDKLEIPISGHRVRLGPNGNLASSTGPIWWPARNSGDESLTSMVDFITSADWFRDIVKPSIEVELSKLSKIEERKPVHNKKVDIYAAQLSGDCEDRFGKPMYPQVAAIAGILFDLPDYGEKQAANARKSIGKLYV